MKILIWFEDNSTSENVVYGIQDF